ncbi:MAG: response regulator [Spirochaetes bacterium]|nr:response regulator [Spirochaetota bacterium]
MSHEKHRVLVVDDEPGICKNLAEYLGDEGFIAEAYESGAEALSAAAKPCDAAILDMMLPGMGGIEIARGLRKVYPHLPIIFMSGKMQLDENALRREGAAAVFQKPFDPEQVLVVLDFLFHTRRPEEAP